LTGIIWCVINKAVKALRGEEMAKKKLKKFDADNWLKEHIEELVDRFAGEYLVIANGQIYRDGTPSQLRNRAQTEHPGIIIMGMRVPRPEDFICALIIR